MSTLIKREDAIEVVCELVPIRDDAVEIADAIRAIPSAEITHDDVMQYCNPRLLVLATVEFIKHQYRIGFEDGKASANRPSGEWIRDGHHIRCKECGAYFCDTDREGDPYPQDFCPNCGARMKDVTEGLESRTDLIWYGDKTDLIGDETGRHTGWFGKGADDEDN